MEEKLRPLKMIHIALCTGVILAYVIVGDLQTMEFLNIPKVGTTLFVFLVIPVGAIFLGNLLYKQQLRSVDKNLTLNDKTGGYQTASVIRWALIEGTAFFILFIKRELLVIGLFLILYLIFLRPSESRMKRGFEAFGR
ncbi:MAG: MFS transporter [Bacteroidota bacterium]